MKGTINHSLSLGTLAGLTLTSSDLADVLVEKAWLSSIKATWSLKDFTPNTDDGPILVGIAYSDYTSAEIEGWIENSGSWTEGDMVQQREISRRFIRKVGTLSGDQNALHTDVLNDGKPIRTKCGWMLRTGQTVKVWAYNEGTSALATTTPKVKLFGHANLWPR